jgi:hypothetical protein
VHNGLCVGCPYPYFVLRTYITMHTCVCVGVRVNLVRVGFIVTPCPPLGANKGVPTLCMEEKHHVTIYLQVLDRQLKAAPHFYHFTKYFVRDTS